MTKNKTETDKKTYPQYRDRDITLLKAILKAKKEGKKLILSKYIDNK